MPESAEDIFRRAVAAADPEGRLPLPPVGDWETFPFEGDIRVRVLSPLVDHEPPRRGTGGVDCWRCASDEGVIWSDEHWLVGSLPKPSGLPVIALLYPRVHCDLDGLQAELAAELGPMILRVEEAVRSVGELGRVHVCRWGDGSEHLHWWFMARPARMPQLVGSFAAIWDDILPPVPVEIWRSNLDAVARRLATAGGRATAAAAS
jgi:diadenosine tetraphosphate (Ap4A) HIT family hydrolase